MYSNSTEDFRDYMRSQGFDLPFGILGDGKIRRCHDRRDKKGERNVWYFFNDGDEPWGMCGYWRTGERHHWSAKGAKRLTREEWRAFSAKIKTEQRRRLADERAKHEAAAVRANAIWNAARAADPFNPYLRKKHVETCGLKQCAWHNDYVDDTGFRHERVVHDALVVPMYDDTGALRSVQAIFANDENVLRRGKDFLRDGQVQGCRFNIGEITVVNGKSVVAICEGFATGASVHKATGLAVIVAFDAGNLKSVATSVREANPDAMIIMVADNDRWTMQPVNNPGIMKAKEAAAAVQGFVAIPDFKSLEGRPTDFNDLYNREGGDTVMEQVMAVIAERTNGAEPHDNMPPAFSDDALAQELARRYANTLRFVKEQGCFLVYDGKVWREDKTCLALDFARKVCRASASAASEADALNPNQLRSLASSRTASAILHLVCSDRRIAATSDQFDADLWLLNTPTGAVDLRTGKIRPHRYDDYATKITEVGPDVSRSTPLWDAFLARVTGGDKELERFLQRAMGYGLTGVTREQVLLFCWGTGGNGKSVFLNTACGILAAYHKAAPMETFTESKSDRHPTEMAGLQGARIVTATETDEGRRWAESKIKIMTGGEKIPARKMRQDFFEYLPQFKLVISGNKKPSFHAVDESIRRRVLLVPFTVTIPKEERDKKLPEKLKAEWPGILNWMIKGCLEWQRSGLCPPDAVVSATREYLEAEDAIVAWLNDECTLEADAFTTSRVAFSSWKNWANNVRESAGSEKRFAQNLAAHGFEAHRRSSARGFLGFTVNQSAMQMGGDACDA